MNKKFIIVIFIAIILISVLITSIYIINNPNNRLKKVYENMLAKQEYIFTTSTINKTNIITIARSGSNMIIDMYNYNEGEHTSIIITNQETYFVTHEEEEYAVYSNSEQDKNILTDELEDIVKLEYVKGKEKVNGKEYFYEEYKGVSYFLNYADINIDIESIKTRFYFDGPKLKYIKTIYNTNNNETMEQEQKESLLKVDMEFKVNDEIFKIPSNYAES